MYAGRNRHIGSFRCFFPKAIYCTFNVVRMVNLHRFGRTYTMLPRVTRPCECKELCTLMHVCMCVLLTSIAGWCKENGAAE